MQLQHIQFPRGKRFAIAGLRFLGKPLAVFGRLKPRLFLNPKDQPHLRIIKCRQSADSGI